MFNMTNSIFRGGKPPALRFRNGTSRGAVGALIEFYERQDP